MRKKLYIDTKQRYNFFFYYFIINFRKQIKNYYYFNMKFFNFLLFFYDWDIFFFYHKIFNLYNYKNIILPKNFKKIFILPVNQFFKINKLFLFFFGYKHIFGNFDFSNYLINYDLKSLKSYIFKNKYIIADYEIILFFSFYYNYLHKQYYDFLNFCYLIFYY